MSRSSAIVFGENVPVLREGVSDTAADRPAKEPYIDRFVGARRCVVECPGQLRPDELIVGLGETAGRIEQDIVGSVADPAANRFAIKDC